MLISCVSASNIKHAGESSTSLRLCNLVKEIVETCGKNKTNVKVIPLVNYELKPCTGCGRCFKKNKCIEDDGFNDIYSQLVKSDGLFIVSAHYAPIPSKLAMLLEKMEQLAFLPRFNNEEDKSPLYQRPAGIIAHGGGTEEIIKGYRGVVINTIANALSWPIEMNIKGIDEDWPKGIAIPINRVKKDTKSIFPIQEYDWIDIKKRIKPLVHNVLKELQNNSGEHDV